MPIYFPPSNHVSVSKIVISNLHIFLIYTYIGPFSIIFIYVYKCKAKKTIKRKMVFRSESSRKLKSKEKQRKGLWSPEEDEKLRSHVLKYGHGCWSTIPIQAGNFYLFTTK